MYKSGADLLNKMYRELYLSKTVSNSGKMGDKPEELIQKYIDRMEHIEKSALSDERKFYILKQFYYDKYVIKQLPNKVVQVTESEEERKQLLLRAQETQKDSLDVWLDYLIKSDKYPEWFKIYAFSGMVGLNKFNRKTNSFGQRTSSTLSPFIELNIQALDSVYYTLKELVNKKNIPDDALNMVQYGDSFKRLYTLFVVNQKKQINSEPNDGKWFMFPMGGNPDELASFLNGKDTTWCSVNKAYARDQLSKGDFYIYCTKDKNGKYTVPRIALRMIGNDTFAEIRGVDPYQNLEVEMYDVLKKKLADFDDCGPEYLRLEMLNNLTKIYNKFKNGQDLSVSELVFIYELENKILGFGERPDYRINEIKMNRDKTLDFQRILREKTLSKFNCDLDLGYLQDLSDLHFPKKIKGSLYLNGTEVLENFTFPNKIEGDLELLNLKKARNIKLPQKVKNVYLDNLQEFEKIIWPSTVEGKIYLRSLKSDTVLTLPPNLMGKVETNATTEYTETNILKIIPTTYKFKEKIHKLWDIFKESMIYNRNNHR